MTKKPLKIYIDTVEISEEFYANSEQFGYDEDAVDSYEDDVLALQDKWQKQGHLEIYDYDIHGPKASYPLVKDSNSTVGSSPYYTGMYHARLLDTGEYDPLVIVTFNGVKVDNKSYEKAVIHGMIYHDFMFLKQGDKSADKMRKRKTMVRNVIDNSDK